MLPFGSIKNASFRMHLTCRNCHCIWKQLLNFLLPSGEMDLTKTKASHTYRTRILYKLYSCQIILRGVTYSFNVLCTWQYIFGHYSMGKTIGRHVTYQTPNHPLAPLLDQHSPRPLVMYTSEHYSMSRTSPQPPPPLDLYHFLVYRFHYYSMGRTTWYYQILFNKQSADIPRLRPRQVLDAHHPQNPISPKTPATHTLYHPRPSTSWTHYPQTIHRH